MDEANIRQYQNQPNNSKQQYVPTNEDEGLLSTSNQRYLQEQDDIEGDDSKEYLQLFQTYDVDNTGKINKNDLIQILNRLGRDNNSVDEIIKQSGFDLTNGIDFNQFVSLITEIPKGGQSGPKIKYENINNQSQTRGPQKIVITPDPKIVDFLRMLYEYNKKCEAEGSYAEAKKAKQKMEEIKQKEIQRQQNNIKFLQEEEIISVENAQKAQFLDFTSAWDNYMADYEATAYMSLEKLKEKHMNEIKEYQESLRNEFSKSFKPSKQLIELRQKQLALGKTKQYTEAEKIKAQADELENMEREIKEKGIEELVEKKIMALRKQQQLTLNVLLKRIQKDRNQQLVNRQMDSQKLILRNRNIRSELVAKHAIEEKKALEYIKNCLSMVQVNKPTGSSDISQITYSTKKDDTSGPKTKSSNLDGQRNSNSREGVMIKEGILSSISSA